MPDELIPERGDEQIRRAAPGALTKLLIVDA